jgi:hypothetical protein
MKTATQSRVHFLNGKFLFFAEHTTNAGSQAFAYYSSDGLTWTASNKITDGRLLTSEFDASPTLTVVAGNNGAQYASSDLVTWTSRPVVPNAAGFDHLDLAYGAGRFFSSINGFGGTTYSSADAVTWTSISQATTVGGSRVASGNNQVILFVGSDRYRTTDGTTFTKFTPTVPTGFISPGGDPWFAGGRFIISAISLQTGESYLSSPDGQTWTQFATFPVAPASAPGQSRVFLRNEIAFGNGKYVIAGNDVQQTLLTRTTLPIIMVLDAPAAPTPPQITTQPVAANAVAGGSVTFSVTASGSGNTYQWRKDGANIAGATSATLTLNNVSTANVGSYSVVITNSVGSATSASVSLELVTASNIGRLINMSIRTAAGTGDNTLIVGATLGGAGTGGAKAVLVRGVGPTLGSFGVTGALADPVVTIFQGTASIAQNDDWSGTFNFANVGAFAFAGAAPRDAAVIRFKSPARTTALALRSRKSTTPPPPAASARRPQG